MEQIKLQGSFNYLQLLLCNVVFSLSQPYAWESREFLRKLVVGKEVNFVVDNTIPSGREYGQLWINKG